LKDGKTLPVDADVSKAREALAKLKTYADQNAQFELKIATEKAQAAITNVDGMLKALDRIQTESRHQVSHNADAARAQILSLNGANTSSTHTIYVKKVEQNATGGLVGGVRQFAEGGAVAAAFPRMSGGSVPGSGHHDSVPRTLDAGAFVIRKAAVQKYGSGALSRLANGVARFATGGFVGGGASKKNREVVQAQKMMELGMQSINTGSWGGPIANQATRNFWSNLWNLDKPVLERMETLKTLTGREKGALTIIVERWQWAMNNSKQDLERELIEYMEQHQGEFYRRGGLSKSDTVPAMLTPGEYVVNRSAVVRLGVGFFEAINNLSAPAQVLAGNALASIQGFATGGLVQPAGATLARPQLPDSTPTRTVRVELAAGGSTVNATVDARDESRLLKLLATARSRTA
jgi:phage-related minor tail protein